MGSLATINENTVILSWRLSGFRANYIHKIEWQAPTIIIKPYKN